MGGEIMNQSKMYNLYDEKTKEKIVELMLLCLAVTEKTCYNVHFVVWGHCPLIDVAIFTDSGNDEIFRTALDFGQVGYENVKVESEKRKKLLIDICLEVIKTVLKKHKVPIRTLREEIQKISSDLGITLTLNR
jgi:hypothetical protein